MSGWIKWEKDLESDPRVLRMARELKRSCNAGVTLDVNLVTLVCGGLVRLWVYADSHCRDDDTLDLGPSEIDDLIGIPNFCSIVPDDWLRQIDERTVELPNFQAHNGIEAKKKALTQKRVETHRKRNSVTEALTTALPDQDQTNTKTNTKKKELRPPAAASTQVIARVRQIYPKRAGGNPWGKAEKAIGARIAEGEAVEDLIAGTERYAAFCAATGKIGTEWVKQAATFFGPDKHYREEWTPPPGKAQAKQDANLAASVQWLGGTTQ